MLRVLANIVLMITVTIFVVINNQHVDANLALTKLNSSFFILLFTRIFSGSFFIGRFFFPKVLNFNKIAKEQSLKSKNNRNKLIGVYARSGIN